MADEKVQSTENTATNENELSASDPGSAALGQPVELAKLREQVEAKQKEATENYDRYLRQIAELENFKKRATREKDEAHSLCQ